MTKMKMLSLISLMGLFLMPTGILSAPVPPQSASDVQVSASTAPDKIKRGRTTKASVVVDIPSGLHIQSSKPLDKYLVPTKLEVTAPQGMRVGPILYPRAVTRQLKFSKGAVAVYEGRSLIRFSVTVPANYSGASGEVKGNLRFQACNDDSCFPPITKEVKVWVNVE